MNMQRLSIVALVLALLAGCAQRWVPDEAQHRISLLKGVVTEADSSIYVVPFYTKGIIGSATYIGDGKFLTVSHVYRTGQQHRIAQKSGEYIAERVNSDDGGRIVTVRIAAIDGSPPYPATSLSRLPDVGARIKLVGMYYVKNRTEGWKVIEARVVPTPDHLPARYRTGRYFCVRTSGAGIKGMSGGAALSEDGSLVGLMEAGIETGDGSDILIVQD